MKAELFRRLHLSSQENIWRCALAAQARNSRLQNCRSRLDILQSRRNDSSRFGA
jgi:hypothetical protein